MVQICVDHAASEPVEPEGCIWGPPGVATATPEVVGTRAMRVAGTTVDLEGMGIIWAWKVIGMGMGGLETMVAEARVVVTTTQEEITETRRAHITRARNKLPIQDCPSKWQFL